MLIRYIQTGKWLKLERHRKYFILIYSYINDLAAIINYVALHILFGDDTTIIVIISKDNNLKIICDNVVSMLQNWFTEIKLTLN